MATVHPRRQRQAPCANTHNPMQVAEASSAILLLGGQGSAHRPAVAQHGDSGGRRRTVRVGGELAAVLLLVCCLSSAAALKCKSNNGNQIDALPTNVTDTYECDDRSLCGAISFLSAPSYFNQVCGDSKNETCSCMLACVPLWVATGEGTWRDPVRSESNGNAYVTVCDEDNCNTECSSPAPRLLSSAALAASMVMMALAFVQSSW